MNCSRPGFPAFHYLLEFAQTHDHWVDDAIQPSHPLWPSSSSVLNLSQHQGLFWWVGSSHQLIQVLDLQLQHLSFQWIFRVDFLWDWLVWCPCCLRDSQEFSQHHNSKVSTVYACMCAKSLQSCPTLCDYMDCSLPGSSVHGIPQTRILEWVALPFSRRSSLPRNWTHVSYLLPWQAGSLAQVPPGKPWQQEAFKVENLTDTYTQILGE